LPPVEAAGKYVEYMGGADAVIERSRRCFEDGEYRWVAEVLRHVVFADPSNQEAREMAAEAMEQLAYQAESSTWRNAYLTGAQELRFGTPDPPVTPDAATADSISALTLPMLFNYLGVRLNGPEAGDRLIVINFEFTDTRETAWLKLENGSLSHSIGRIAAEADATVVLERSVLNRIIAGDLDLVEQIEQGAVKADPDPAPLLEIVGLLDSFSPWFAVIEP
jgi:alkyl sulfatase BDS1-like metallo-beta-lactamase superfamily hydrolase